MKKVFLGLVVAVVALSASAFTNVNSSAQGPFRTVSSRSGTTYSFNASQNPTSCTETPSPCLIRPIAPYTLPASGTISATDLFDAGKVEILSTQSQL